MSVFSRVLGRVSGVKTPNIAFKLTYFSLLLFVQSLSLLFSTKRSKEKYAT